MKQMPSFNVFERTQRWSSWIYASGALYRCSQTTQYVILTYMKYLGVKAKEPRGLEHKRARMNFLPKMKV